MIKTLLGVILSLLVFSVQGSEVQPLPLDKAFVFTPYVGDHNEIVFEWNIAPNYYLYQNKFKFTLLPPNKLSIGKIVWPKNMATKTVNGVVYQTYAGVVRIIIPVTGETRGPVTLQVHYQGCSYSGFCYPPVNRYLHIDISKLTPHQDLSKNVSMTSNPKPFLSDQDMTQAIFAGHNLFYILLSFLGLGLLLAFTPCVLPMIPILSGIIVGHKKNISTLHAFSLSLAYVLGMAVTYALVGMIVALLGSSIQVFFQQTWIIILFSILFVLLSLSLFGWYDLQLPARWQHHTTRLSNRLESGTHIGVFLMGCLSTLIVSPCVSAPLVGVLAYIAQTGDVILGATSLLMLGIGMGIPLLLIGTSAGKWLPKAGAWMDLTKKFFGILLLGVAIWMLSRILPGAVSLILWAILMIGTGIFLGVFHKKPFILRIAGSFILLYGIIVFIGGLMGSTDILHPWDGWNKSVRLEQENYFKTVMTPAQLDQQLLIAKQQKKPVILDFYADWCVSCVLMNQHVFSRDDVHKALDNYVRLRVDITRNTADDQAIMKQYNVIAPPAMVFFDTNGKNLTPQPVVGEMDKDKFLQLLDSLKE